MQLTRISYGTISASVLIILAGLFTLKLRSNSSPNLNVQDLSRLNQAAQAYILPVSQTNYLPIRNFNVADLETNAKAAGIFDVRSERFLYAKNITEKLPIASITKLMTAIIVIENLPLNDSFVVSAEDINVDGQGADLTKGEVIRGSDLLKIMLIESSNDAAMTFTSNAARKNMNLVSKMNDKAKLIGMADTRFNDPAGLADGDSFSTVEDLVKLVRYVGKYQIIWDILLTRSADVSSIDGRISRHLINTNRLLDLMADIIGGKTGYTDGALETMVLEVPANGGHDRIISVVLGTNDRFGETKKLIDWARNAYRW